MVGFLWLVSGGPPHATSTWHKSDSAPNDGPSLDQPVFFLYFQGRGKTRTILFIRADVGLTLRRGTVKGNRLEANWVPPQPPWTTRRSPFRYFKTSPEIIRLVVMMYIRFPLSLRNVEDRLHERGIEISHETVRFWWNKFGQMFAAEIRRKRVEQMRAAPQWLSRVDDVFVKIDGERHCLWRAVDHEGEVLEEIASTKRDRKSALKFLRKSMKRYGRPEAIATDRLRSHGAALRDLGGTDLQITGRWLNNRAENSHQPLRRRERMMLRFRRMRSLQKFAAVHSSVHNLFNQERHLSSRDNFKLKRTAALADWRQFGAA